MAENADAAEQSVASQREVQNPDWQVATANHSVDDSGPPRRRPQRRPPEATGPAADKPRRVLLLYSGPADRKDGLPNYLRLLGCQVDAVDVINEGEHQNLLDETAWAFWMAKIRQGEYSVVFGAPPRETFSRARNYPGGHPPLRSKEAPYGVPGLTPAQKEQARIGTVLAVRMAEACRAQQETGGRWGFEHPETREDEVNITDLHEVKALVAGPEVISIRFDQCIWGAPTTEPTVIYTWRLNLSLLMGRCTHPQQQHVDADGRTYWASHPWLLCQDQQGSFRTAAANVYPDGMNRKLAVGIVAAATARAPNMPTGN